ncbi:MAG TPA: hypothetical protein VIX60_07945 [Candidatus Cybelea sp.]
MRITRSLSAIILTVFMAALPLTAPAQLSVGVGFSVGAPPPPLPVYSQPVAPYPNYQWTPGYWGWGPGGYYWVPGTWVAPPSVGVYWTPGYWGAGYNGAYAWNTGYWGPSVGFYGGINYGFGYFGAGFVGGYWAGNAFRYNGAVMNVNRNVVRNVYVNKSVINKSVHCGNNCHVSYNGGRGGVSARPTSGQIAARQHSIPPTTAQRNQARVAAQDRNLYANVNHGRPPVTASQKAYNDPKQLPHYAPVTAADKQAAQKNVKTSNGANNAPVTQPKAQPKPATQAKPVTQPKPASQPKHNPAPVTQPHHNAPATNPQHKSPPPNQMHSQAMHGQSGGHSQGGSASSQSKSRPQGAAPKAPDNGGNKGGKPPLN